MRRRALAVLLLTLPAPAAEAAPPGGPEVVRAWRPADERIHPDARHEQWLLRATDPRTGRMFAVSLSNFEDWSRIEVGHSRMATGDVHAQTRFAPVGGQPRWVGDGIAAVVRRTRRGVVIRITSREVNGWARLRRGRPGISALRWRIHHPSDSKEASNWTMPFADGRVDASFTLRPAPGVSLPNGSFRIRGWRGTYGHMWGRYGRPMGAHFNEFTTWRGATTWHLIGSNRPDTVIEGGDRARDPYFAGVLARIGPGGTRICRPKVRRNTWGPPTIPPNDYTDSLLYHAYVVTARCRHGTVRFRRVMRPEASHGTSTFFGDVFATARSSGGGRGIAWSIAG